MVEQRENVCGRVKTETRHLCSLADHILTYVCAACRYCYPMWKLLHEPIKILSAHQSYLLPGTATLLRTIYVIRVLLYLEINYNHHE